MSGPNNRFLSIHIIPKWRVDQAITISRSKISKTILSKQISTDTHSLFGRQNNAEFNQIRRKFKSRWPVGQWLELLQ